MADNEKKSFILYKSYYKSVESLTMEERGKLFTAIFEYQIDGKVITPLSPLCSMAFSFIQSQFEIDKNKYLDIVERNRANGSKGGRPKNNTKKPNTHWVLGCKNVDVTRDFATSERTQKDKQKNPKADNDNEDEDDNEDDNDNDNDITSPPISPSKEGETTTTTTVCNSARAQDREIIEFEVIKFFSKHHFISNVEDFIAYNKARDWKGYGGEDILDDWERYAWKWETEEHHRRGDVDWTPPLDL